MKTVAFHTLGCKLNYSETSAISRKCTDKGFHCHESFDTEADIYVLNTCSVTENADKEARQLIRKALRINPDAKIVVMGCFAQLQPEKISSIEGVNLVVGTQDKFRLPDLLSEICHHEKLVYHGGIGEVEHFHVSSSIGGRTRSFLKVQDGCDYPCTYCTIPLARGQSRSGSPEDILNELEIIKKQGIKEIVLTGVNVGDYKYHDPKSEKKLKLLDLLKLLEDNSGTISRFRISSIEPNLLHDDIIKFVASSSKFMPHFHVPLQSGSNAILGKMKRRYRRELYAEKVHLIKNFMPHACIGADVMVGFPGETDELFNETREFLHALPVSYLHVFTYSARPNTEAFSMQGHVNEKVKKERNKILRILSDKKTSCFYLENLNKNFHVLTEKIDEQGFAYGHTENYIYAKFLSKKPIRANEIKTVSLLEIQPENGDNIIALANAIE
ncbi:MAG: tRNA (N(6)-L-threonylcarbamoyladenosine(37)-C(2))-methylthiotransferase MtaB [Bacteroidia bacterium]|nr:tRNA (N(6)-L-threonylcarbamoyladenosine(37)-C(2))-methylthiotransferase MtaB [Bacteroidia bacterium]